MIFPTGILKTWLDAQRNFDQLRTRLGFEIVKLGTLTLTWPGGNNFSNNLAVTHKLVISGKPIAPKLVLVVNAQNPGANQEIRGHAILYTATQFTAYAKYDPVVPGAGFTNVMQWIAFA